MQCKFCFTFGVCLLLVCLAFRFVIAGCSVALLFIVWLFVWLNVVFFEWLDAYCVVLFVTAFELNVGSFGFVCDFVDLARGCVWLL